ncbi:MAG: hypothetical protein E7657_01530 [Ruminococcaceae bacterium]|nr:hypothetical protein [Oscillospiraceae bacterium]
MTSCLKRFLFFLKFYFVFAVFGMLANVITYTSADLLFFVESGCTQSYWMQLMNSTDANAEIVAWRAFNYFWQTAFRLIPFDGFFETTLGSAFDGADGNIFTFVIGLFGEDGCVLKPPASFWQQTPLILKDGAIAALSSFVIFAVLDFKKRVLASKSFASKLGFAFAFPFWIFAGYTFANCLITSLELIFNAKQSSSLYFWMIVLGVLLMIFIQWVGSRTPLKRGFALRTAVYWVVKIVFIAIEAFLAWLLCRSVTDYLSLRVIPTLAIISAFFIFVSMLDQYVNEWATTGVLPIKVK